MANCSHGCFVPVARACWLRMFLPVSLHGSYPDPLVISLGDAFLAMVPCAIRTLPCRDLAMLPVAMAIALVEGF